MSDGCCNFQENNAFGSGDYCYFIHLSVILNVIWQLQKDIFYCFFILNTQPGWVFSSCSLNDSTLCVRVFFIFAFILYMYEIHITQPACVMKVLAHYKQPIQTLKGDEDAATTASSLQTLVL